MRCQSSVDFTLFTEHFTFFCFIHSFSSIYPYRRHSFTMGLKSTYGSLLALASAVMAQKCPLAFDGRVPAGSTPALFDTEASPFGTEFVKCSSNSSQQSNPTKRNVPHANKRKKTRPQFQPNRPTSNPPRLTRKFPIALPLFITSIKHKTYSSTQQTALSR